MANDDVPFIIYGTPSEQFFSSEARRPIASRAASHLKRKRRVTSRTLSSPDLALRRSYSSEGSNSGAGTSSSSFANGTQQPETASGQHTQLASPVTILQKGNSDPFNTFPITVNARVNRLLRFGRDCVDPAYRFYGPRGFKPSDLIPEFSHYQSLTDPCTAYIVLSFFASCMAVVSSQAESTIESLVLKSLASKVLRRQILEQDILSGPAGASLVYRMYRAEVLDNNLSGAQVHARMLKRMFTSPSQQQKDVDLSLLTLVLYQGNTLCATQFLRSFFNDTWVKQVFSQSWIEAGAITNNPWDPDIVQLDPTVSDTMLQEVFRDLQNFYHTSEEVSVLALPSGPSTWWLFVSQCEWLQMRLMNCYHDIREDGNDSSIVSSEIQSCLCLAALYTLRNLQNNPIIHNRPLYKSSIAIYQKLGEGLLALDTLGCFHDLNIYSNVILWVLFVLAVAEHDLKVSNFSAPPHYYQKRLAKNAKAAHVYTWMEALTIFKGFAFSETDLPQPYEHWFDEILRHEMEETSHV